MEFRQCGGPADQLDHYIAEELFGWQWMSFVGIPTRGTEGYPKERRVRQFMPARATLGERWEKYLQKTEGALATGDEPLSYCYCSSVGPHSVPWYSSQEDMAKDMEKEIHRRGLWDKYQEILADVVSSMDGKPGPLQFASCEHKCIAALVAVGSKYVEMIES